MFHVEHFEGVLGGLGPNCSTWNISKQLGGLFWVKPARVQSTRSGTNSLQRKQWSVISGQFDGGRVRDVLSRVRTHAPGAPIFVPALSAIRDPGHSPQDKPTLSQSVPPLFAGGFSS
jgi:hypothetical protein